MTWSDFFLICFAAGFGFSFLSFMFGGGRVGRVHLPHFHGHGLAHLSTGAHGAAAGAPGVHTGAGQAPVAAHGATASQAPQAARGTVSPFNLVTLTAFLAWFGGTGYLLTRYSSLWVGFALLLATAVGLVGGAIVFLFVSKLLISAEENLDPADYDMVGVLGRLSVSIRDGGTGELIYSQAGTRRVCGARSEDGSAIGKGTEVVVSRYEKGIAYVRAWDEIANE